MKLNVPVCVGVPLTVPVDAFSVRPLGMAPLAILHVTAPVPPVVCRSCEYVWPEVPAGSGELVVI